MTKWVNPKWAIPNGILGKNRQTLGENKGNLTSGF